MALKPLLWSVWFCPVGKNRTHDQTQSSGGIEIESFFCFFFQKTNVILLKFTNSQLVGPISYSEALQRKKKKAHLMKYSPPLKYLVAIFRDLNDFNVFKAHNIAFLLPAFSTFFLTVIFKIFWCGPFKKSLLNLLQYCFSYILVFWLWGTRDVNSLTRDHAHMPCIGR